MISAIKEISNKADNGYKMRLSRTLEGRRFGETDGHSDGRTDERMDEPSHRDAKTHQKTGTRRNTIQTRIS